MNKLISFITVLLFLYLLHASAQAKEALLKSTAIPSIKQSYANTDNGQIHYWVAGNGPALLLIHQSSSSVEEYAGMVTHLAEQYRLIAFDWPGHGSSDDPIKELGIEEFTLSAVAVLDHLHIQNTHVLGHHGGALIAMNLAWKHPQRVNKLILSGTSGLKKKVEMKKFTENLDLKKRHQLEKDGKSISDAWKRYVGYMPHSTAEEILIPFLNNIITRIRPYDAHYGVLRWNRRPALEGIKDRTILLMQGESDEYVSRQETLLEILPNSERVVIKNAGTFVFFEKAAASAEVIKRFLAKP